MRCVTPMFRQYYKSDPKNGRVVSRAEAMQDLEADPNTIRKKIKYFNKNPLHDKAYQLIPCRNCWACQLNYSAEWATRIMLEAKKTPGLNWFITLTYDDENIPILESINTRDYGLFENDGTWTGSLYEPDMVTFIHSLKKRYRKYGYKCKYFYCGEYGETTQRPHFHIILLNCPLDIRQFYDCHVDKNFKAHWKSKEIGDLWGKGMVDIAELEWSCAAYVARYCTKKMYLGSKNEYKYYEQGKMPEYIRMSKGLAYDWYKEHKDEIYNTDEIIMKTIKGNVGSIKPPKAFDRLMKEADPDFFEKIKKSREKAAERADKMMQSLTDRTDKDNLILNAEKVKQKMGMLPRVGEW